MLAALAIVLGSFSTAPSVAPALEIAPIELVDATAAADLIVRGRIARVVTLPCAEEPSEWFSGGLVVAEIAVERVLKGDPSVKRALYLAQPTWICDATSGAVGDKGLFLLEASGRWDAHRQRTNGAFEREWNDGELLDLVASGQGKYLEREHEGRTYLTDRGVTAPKDLPVLKVGYHDLIEPSVLERYVTDLVAKQSKPLLSLEQLDASVAAPWRLDMTRDGALALTPAPAGLARRPKCDDRKRLEDALMLSAIPASSEPIEVRGTTRAAFRLTLHAKDGPQTFEVRIVPDTRPTTDGEQRMNLVWSALRSSLEDVELPDDVRSSLSLGARRKR